jgi:hypothetical protein
MNYIEAAFYLNPSIQCSVVGDPNIYENVEWVDAENKPSKEALDAVVPTLIKKAKWKEIQKMRDSRLELGGFPVGSYWFHSDVYAQANYTDLLMMGSNIPAGLQWKTMSGVFVTMTQTLAQQILGAKALQKNLTFVKAEQHRAAMEASSDPASYDFSGGWPPIYGE